MTVMRCIKLGELRERDLLTVYDVVIEVKTRDRLLQNLTFRQR